MAAVRREATRERDDGRIAMCVARGASSVAAVRGRAEGAKAGPVGGGGTVGEDGVVGQDESCGLVSSEMCSVA